MKNRFPRFGWAATTAALLAVLLGLAAPAARAETTPATPSAGKTADRRSGKRRLKAGKHAASPP